VIFIPLECIIAEIDKLINNLCIVQYTDLAYACSLLFVAQYGHDDGSTFKVALLSGPPGIGKTTTATLACKVKEQ